MPKSNTQPTLDLEPATGPAVVVLGRDDAAKAHASYFTADQTLSARAAAAAMGMMVLPITTDEQRALAKLLPAGKIFASGKAFVPFVKSATYDQLIAHVPLKNLVRQPLRLVKPEEANTDDKGGTGGQSATNGPTANKAPPLSLPTDWSGLVPGSVVLANETADEGWWAAVVVAVNGHLINLKWRDVDLASFVKPVTELALLHPSSKVTA